MVFIERGDESVVLGCGSCALSIAEVHVCPDIRAASLLVREGGATAGAREMSPVLQWSYIRSVGFHPVR